MDDLNQLLADILDDSKPLPVATPTVAKAALSQLANANGGNIGITAMDNPETFLAAEMTDKSDEDFLADLMADVTTPAPVQPIAEAVHTACETPAPEQASMPFLDSAVREEGATIVGLKMPEFVAEDFADTMDIRNFASLVTLQTQRWHAKVKDRQASRDAATASDAHESAFETRKRLLAGADDQLKAIHKIIDEARGEHYRMTLPWTTTGMDDTGRRTGGRLLPNTLFVEYTTVMADCKARMTAALDAFVQVYPEMIELAKVKLGKRFDAREYPNPSAIREHFGLSFDFQPIPKGDDFKGLPQAQLDALARKVNDNTRKMAENAMQELWARVYETVGRMAERLCDPNKLFHNSLVENVREVAKLLAHLNITSDPKVEAIRGKIVTHLCQHDAKVLREKPVLRQQVGAHAASIIQEMQQ